MFLPTVNSATRTHIGNLHAVPLGDDVSREQGFVRKLDDSEQGFWRNGDMELERHPDRRMQELGRVPNLFAS